MDTFEIIISAIVIVIAVNICIAYNRWLKKRGSKKYRFIEHAKSIGAFTEGKTVDTKFYGGIRDSDNRNVRNDSLVVKYEYIVNGKSYYKKMEFQSPGLVSIEYPSNVIVYYDVNNPKKAVCKEELNERQSRLVKVILLFIVVMTIMVNVLKLLNILTLE